MLRGLSPRQDAKSEHCGENDDESRRRNGAFRDWPPCFLNSYRRRLRSEALMRGIVTEEWRAGQPSVATGSLVKFGQALLRNDIP